MLARFSTDTAIASTCRVIQLSTSSFCFAASRPVGPSQMSSTPSSRAASSAPTRQLTKYGSPLAFGIIAMTGRRPAGQRLRIGLPAGAGAGSDRTIQTFVPATRTAPARMAAQNRDLTVSHGVSSFQSADVSRATPGAVARPDRARSRRSSSDTGQDAGQLGRQRGELQSVLQHRDDGRPEHRAPDRSAAAGDRRAAEHHGRDRRRARSRCRRRTAPGRGAPT